MNLGKTPLIRFLLVLGLAATANLSSASTLVSPDFPGVRWGFTTINFLPHLPVTVGSSNAHIYLAKAVGFQWIELRGPDAALPPDVAVRRNTVESIKSLVVERLLQPREAATPQAS